MCIIISPHLLTCQNTQKRNSAYEKNNKQKTPKTIKTSTKKPKFIRNSTQRQYTQHLLFFHLLTAFYELIYIVLEILGEQPFCPCRPSLHRRTPIMDTKKAKPRTRTSELQNLRPTNTGIRASPLSNRRVQAFSGSLLSLWVYEWLERRILYAKWLSFSVDQSVWEELQCFQKR